MNFLILDHLLHSNAISIRIKLEHPARSHLKDFSQSFKMIMDFALFFALLAGLFLERAREPDALYFAPGHTRFAGREPGLLSQFWLGIFYPCPSALDDLMMTSMSSSKIEDFKFNSQFSTNEWMRKMKSLSNI